MHEYPIITDLTGRWLAHPRMDFASRTIPPGEINPFTPLQRRAILSSTSGELDYTLHGVRKWTVFTRFRPWKWLIFYTLPVDTKYAAANRIRLILTSIFSGMLLLAGIFFWRVTRKLTRRIQLLDTAALQITSGSLETTIPDLGEDELGRLASSLESMRRSIRAQFSALDRKNEELKEENRHRAEAEELVRRSLQEKEALLKEIHHRVKNNLQTISSLLRLQMDRVESDTAASALTDSVNRVHSMALVHEQLYRSEDLAEIEMGELFNKLLSGINRGINGGKIRIRNTCRDRFLRIEQAIPCSLIVNELVTNAIKHAFPGEDNNDAEIVIGLTQEEAGLLQLEVRDTGIGIPDGIVPEQGNTLGLNLVYLLAGQLGGSLEILREGGSRFRILFPEEKPL